MIKVISEKEFLFIIYRAIYLVENLNLINIRLCFGFKSSNIKKIICTLCQ